MRVHTQRCHGVTHDFHSEEKNPEPEKNVPQGFDQFSPGDHADTESDGDDQQGIISQFEGDHLRGDGGADIRSQDYTQRTAECHQFRLNETDQHDRGGAAGLNNHGYKRAHQHGDQAIAGQGGKNNAHLMSGRQFEAVAHFFKAVKEKGQSAEQSRHQQCPRYPGRNFYGE